MEIGSETLSKINDIYKKRQDDLIQLRKSCEIAETHAKTWADLLEYINNDWSIHTQKQLDKILSEQAAYIQQDNRFIHEIQVLINKISDDTKKAMIHFPSLLDKECKASNIIIDKESRHPKYTFEKGFITLTVNEAKNTAKITDYEGTLAELPLDIAAVIEVIKTEYNRLFSREFDNMKFLKLLRKQYLDILKKENKPDGAAIQIRHITTRMGKNIRGFRTDEFLVDLSKYALSKTETLEIDRRKLDLQQTKDTSQGMLLYGAPDRGYIGFVVFKEK